MTGRRWPSSRLVATALVLLGAGVVVLAAGRTWVQITVVGLPGPDHVSVDGRTGAPGSTALALVAAAGAVVLATSGRFIRTIVAALLVLAGAGIVAVVVGVVVDPSGIIDAAVATATGTTGGERAAMGRGTPWPMLSAGGGVVVALGGLLALVRGRRWAGPSRRFERDAVGDVAGNAAGVPAGGAPGAEPAEGEVQPSVTGTKVTGREPGSEAQAVRSGKDDRLEAWDRLSAGEDPTD